MLVNGLDWAQIGTSHQIKAGTADSRSVDKSETQPISSEFANGRGGFRTCDLSRVKRALSH